MKCGKCGPHEYPPFNHGRTERETLVIVATELGNGVGGGVEGNKAFLTNSGWVGVQATVYPDETLPLLIELFPTH